MAEYLEGVRALYNTNKYSCFKIETTEGNYKIKIPFIKDSKGNREDIFIYSLSIKDWCRTRHIIIKDYFGFKHQRLIEDI